MLSTRKSRHQKAAASAIALFSIGMVVAGHVAEQTASTSASSGRNSAAALELQEETRAAKTIAGIRAAGALQATYDRKTSRYSAVFPAGSALPALPASVDTVSTPWDKASIDRFGEVVKAGTWAPGATDHTYVYSVDAKTGKLDLRTSAPPMVVEALPQEFRSLLQVRYSDSGATELGRTDDLSPFKGGASIRTAAKTCSSGFSVKHRKTGQRGLITAAHCWTEGVEVLTAAGNPIGTVTARNAEHDIAMITGKTYSYRMYVGPLSGNSTAYLKGSGDAAPGFEYCASGQSSGTTCNHVMVRDDVTMCKQFDAIYRCISHLAVSTNGNSVLEGDSGGAFYRKQSETEVSVRGTVVGKYDGQLYTQQYGTISEDFNVIVYAYNP